MNESLLCTLDRALIGAQALVCLTYAAASWRRWRFNPLWLAVAALLLRLPWCVFPVCLYLERNRLRRLSPDPGAAAAMRRRIGWGWATLLYAAALHLALGCLLIYGAGMERAEGMRLASLAAGCALLPVLIAQAWLLWRCSPLPPRKPHD